MKPSLMLFLDWVETFTDYSIRTFTGVSVGATRLQTLVVATVAAQQPVRSDELIYSQYCIY